MFIYDMLLAIVLAIIVIAILTPTGRYRARNTSGVWLFFFPLLFLLIWSVGAWLTPVGPSLAGVYWLSFAIPALFLLLLLFALSNPSGPSRKDSDVTPVDAEEEATAGTVIAFTVFFWTVIAAALLAVIVRYV